MHAKFCFKKIILASSVFYTFCLADSLFGSNIKFRLPDSQTAFEILSQKNRIRPVEDFNTRLECAQEIYDFYSKILKGETAIRPSDYERLETLIDEFSDEIALIKLEEESEKIKAASDSAQAIVSGRLATYIRGVSAYPLEEGEITISPAANLSVVNSKKNLWLNIGARSKNTTDGSDKMKINEAYIGYEFAPADSLSARIRAGRIYFLLGHLGLIGDNNFDAFEGAHLELDFSKSGFKSEVIFSRLSSTNYPRTREFESCDDYWAARVSKNFADGNFEVGANVLFSGIASEDAVSADMWWRTPFNKRQVVAEYALYRPTKNGIIGDENPYNSKYAFVLGFDAVNGKNFNAFIQLGDIQKGFAPMATSLSYSAQEHLYFDPDTRGVDVSLTYYPSVKDETSPWSTRPPTRDLELPRTVFYELNVVELWSSSSGQKSQGRYILRHGRPVFKDVKFYLENTAWVKEPTEVWVYDRSVYNETKIFIVYEF